MMKVCFPQICVLALIVSAGCDSEPQVGDTIGSADDPVVIVDSDDPAMEAAVAEARRTVGEFVKALQNPPPGSSDFAVKKKFVDGDQVEFMWLTSPTYANGEFTGTLGNDPQLVSNATPGTRYSVKETEIEDWLYFQGDEMKGAFSVKVLQQITE
jgi:uncharacterized protein YegJ (DUF2314 family)